MGNTMLEQSEFSSDLQSDDLIQSVLMRAPMAIAGINIKGEVLASNHRFQEVAGMLAQNARVVSIQELLPSIDDIRWAKLWQLLEDRERLLIHEILGNDPVQRHTVELTLLSVGSGAGRRVFMYLQDIESQHQTQGIQLLQHEVLEAVARGDSIRNVMDLLCRRVDALAPEVICTVLLVDSEGRVHPCAAPGMPAIFSDSIEGEPIGPKAGSCGTAAWRGEPVEVTDIAHDPLWDKYKALALPLGLAACWSSPIKLRDGRVAGTFALYYREPRGASAFHREMVHACVHLCSMAIEHEETEQQIHQLAFYDPLTGLPNRSLLWDRAQQVLNRVVRNKQPLAVLFLDLDRFKTVNDSLGHSRGDHLLKTVAQRLQQNLRTNDTVARLGGDEFVLLLPDMDATQAGLVADKLLASLIEPVMIDTTEVSPTASIGISVAPHDGSDFDTLQKHADVAMYQAKAAGRNTYRFFQPQMNEAVVQRLGLEAALRKAIAENEFTVYFQPQFQLATNGLHGMEALVRWQHPEWGMVSPAAFIPLAEETGLISQIDQYVMEEVCRQMVQWRECGLGIDSVSVNLSVADFQYADIFEQVSDLLQRYPMPPQSLTLEITESLMLNSADETLAMLHRLRNLGVKLAVDDFGTGYSSLSYLKQFPVNELKLDRSFVRDLAEDPSDRALANAIVQLGETFSLTVVAEGVETKEQLDILVDMGCAVAQGFFFAYPMSGDAMTEWLRERA